MLQNSINLCDWDVKGPTAHSAQFHRFKEAPAAETWVVVSEWLNALMHWEFFHFYLWHCATCTSFAAICDVHCDICVAKRLRCQCALKCFFWLRGQPFIPSSNTTRHKAIFARMYQHAHTHTSLKTFIDTWSCEVDKYALNLFQFGVLFCMPFLLVTFFVSVCTFLLYFLFLTSLSSSPFLSSPFLSSPSISPPTRRQLQGLHWVLTQYSASTNVEVFLWHFEILVGETICRKKHNDLKNTPDCKLIMFLHTYI